MVECNYLHTERDEKFAGMHMIDTTHVQVWNYSTQTVFGKAISRLLLTEYKIQIETSNSFQGLQNTGQSV